VNPTITAATAARVLAQLRRDRRTVAYLLLVPCVLITLLKFVLDGNPGSFERIGGPSLGLWAFIGMFLVASVTMLRERTTGTLERLMTLPLAKIDLLVGYAGGFTLVAIVQAILVSSVAFGLLGLEVSGSHLAVVALVVGNAVLGMALGLFVSAFAHTEFQTMQFMPAFVFPQLLLCGLFVPRAEMAPALEAASNLMPLTYAYDALARVSSGRTGGGRLALDVAIIAGTTLLALILGATTLRRRTP